MARIDIYKRVQELKKLERAELRKALREYGNETENGYERVFEGYETPVIAGYSGDEPCDIVVRSVSMNEKDEELTLIGEDKNCKGYEYKIEPGDIFAGQLEYVIDAI